MEVGRLTMVMTMMGLAKAHERRQHQRHDSCHDDHVHQSQTKNKRMTSINHPVMANALSWLATMRRKRTTTDT